jgi:hypothetical protein
VLAGFAPVPVVEGGGKAIAALHTDGATATMIAVPAPYGHTVAQRFGVYLRERDALDHATCVAGARHELADDAVAATHACLIRRTAALGVLVDKLAKRPPLAALAAGEELEPLAGCRDATIAIHPVEIDALAMLQRVDNALGGVDIDPLTRTDDAEALFVAGAALAERGRDGEAVLARSVRPPHWRSCSRAPAASPMARTSSRSRDRRSRAPRTRSARSRSSKPTSWSRPRAAI